MEFDTHRRIVKNFMAEAINPFTGETDSGSVTDYIQDDMEMDMSVELDAQLNTLKDELDIIFLYRSYLNKGNTLRDIEQLGLNLAIQSLSTKVNMINNNVIGSLNVVAEMKFKTIQTILNDTQKYLSYIQYTHQDCIKKVIPQNVHICGVDSYAKFCHDLELLNQTHDYLNQIHDICTDTTCEAVLVPKMYDQFTLLSKLGIAIQSRNGRIVLEYTSPNKTGCTLSSLGYKSMTEIQSAHAKLLECTTKLNYHPVLESITSMESIFTDRVDKFNTKLQSNDIMIGDDSYIQQFVNMLVYKKRLVIMAKLFKASLALTNEKVKQYAKILNCLDGGSTA